MKKKRFCSNLLLIFFYSFDKIKDRNGNGSIIVYIFYIFLLLFPFMFHLKFNKKKKIISKIFFLSLRSITSIQNSGIPGIPLKKKMKWRLCNIPGLRLTRLLLRMPLPTQETLTSKSTTHLMNRSVAYLLRGYMALFLN